MSLSISSFPQLSSSLIEGTYTDNTSESSSILSIYQQQDSSTSTTESIMEMSSDLESGAAAEVSGGTVTLSDSEDSKSLEINPRDSIAIMENGEEGMIISNETTGEAINFERSETVEVSGSGQFEMFASESSDLLGNTDRIRLEGGESAVLTDEGEGLVLSKNNFTGEISVPEAGSTIDIAGDSGEQLSLANFDGESLSFNPGDEAEVRKTEDGLVFENISSGETLTVQSGDTLSASGEAELNIGDGLGVEGGDSLETTVNTEATLENKTVRESVPVAQGNTESTSDLSLLQGYSSPQTAQMSLFGSLVSELV